MTMDRLVYNQAGQRNAWYAGTMILMCRGSRGDDINSVDLAIEQRPPRLLLLPSYSILYPRKSKVVYYTALELPGEWAGQDRVTSP